MLAAGLRAEEGAKGFELEGSRLDKCDWGLERERRKNREVRKKAEKSPWRAG